MAEAAASGARLVVVDGSGLHFIVGGAGLRAGYDGYLSDIARTMQAFRAEQAKDVSTGAAGGGGKRGRRGGDGGRGGGGGRQRPESASGPLAVLVKTLIEPYSTAGATNVINNGNIASMNMAAVEALREATCPGGGGDGGGEGRGAGAGGEGGGEGRTCLPTDAPALPSDLDLLRNVRPPLCRAPAPTVLFSSSSPAVKSCPPPLPVAPSLPPSLPRPTRTLPLLLLLLLPALLIPA
jgi:hypothetical protein